MRNPKRINKILRLIEEIWEDNPDLRLTQLLLNTGELNYYTEDDKLTEALKICYQKRL
jgi:uncharacterized protein YihD (DUF1040 family)